LFSRGVSNSHSRRRLPPLNAARAFEACARLGSTVAAAAALGVTHGAVSKQISVLESWLGVSLFHRAGVRLSPTSAGARHAAVGPEGVDLALRTGRGPWAGVRAEPLLTDHLIPVCAPSVGARLREPRDLARATLLHDEDPLSSWPHWLDEAGLGRPAWGDRGPRFADGALLLQAALAGHGVALGRKRLAAAHLRSGRLVQPFGPALSLGHAYWLVLPARGPPMNRPARAFASWTR